ncbi:MAG: hypothetical protein SGILL_007429, partial [Bacillariaceae sp.]
IIIIIMPPFNPFEIRNQRRQQNFQQHEGSPLLRSDEASLSEDEMRRILFKTTPRKRFHCSIFVKGTVLSVCAIAVIALVWITLAFTSATKETIQPVEPVREHVLPTLLSVVDPETNGYVYALNNSLYETMFHSVDFVSDFENCNNKRCKGGCELPKLWLDKSSISATTNDAMDTSMTLTWSMGRERNSGNILIQDDDVIALYCQENGNGYDQESLDPRSFLEAATIAQARATSVRHGGRKGDNTWLMRRFPILRRDSCFFRLYMVVPPSSSRRMKGKMQFVHVASTDPITIVQAKEMPTAIHLAYSESYSKMVVQFTTGNLTTSTIDAVPVVRYDEKLVKGTSESYSASDLCQEPGNLTEAGKFYPPGMIHTVELSGLDPSTKYQYQVGLYVDGAVSVWSDPASFVTAPKDGDKDADFSYIVYGDQGCPATGCHDGKRWLQSMVDRETNVTSVHHFGDIR